MYPTCPQRRSILHNYIDLDLQESVSRPVLSFKIANNILHRPISINYLIFKNLDAKVVT